MPGFPNLYCMYGPGTNAVNGASIIYNSECQMRYIMGCIDMVLAHGARSAEPKADVAAESAAAIGARHIIRSVGPQEFIDAIPEIVWYLDEPVADPALVPLYFIAKEARKHVKVVLSGEGADELFGGYTIYKEPLSLKPFDRLPGTLRRLAGRVSDRIPEGTRGKSLLHRGSMTLEDRYYGNARIFREEQLAGLLRTAAQENPALAVQLVQIDADASVLGADGRRTGETERHLGDLVLAADGVSSRTAVSSRPSPLRRRRPSARRSKLRAALRIWKKAVSRAETSGAQARRVAATWAKRSASSTVQRPL